MTAVAATRWKVAFRREMSGLRKQFDSFMALPQIIVTKKTKAGQKETDIKPFVYEALLDDNNVFDLLLKSGSQDNVKPSLFMEAFLRHMQVEDSSEKVQSEMQAAPMPAGFLKLHRVETYLSMQDEAERAYLAPMIERDKNLRIYLE